MSRERMSYMLKDGNILRNALKIAEWWILSLESQFTPCYFQVFLI